MKTIKVVAAVVIEDEKILCVQRGPSKYDYISEKWEFPGGKVEEGETPEEGLVREIEEELHTTITDLNFLIQVDHTYPNFRIIMDTYTCKIEKGSITLTEHIAFDWEEVSNLDRFDWAAADLPIVRKIKETL